MDLANQSKFVSPNVCSVNKERLVTGNNFRFEDGNFVIFDIRSGPRIKICDRFFTKYIFCLLVVFLGF